MFLVEVKVSAGNDIDVTIEAEGRDITLDDCTELNNYLCANIDREAEDYSLTVGSAGLTRPFRVPAQFRKAVGSKVELLVKGGRKISGATLEEAGTEGVRVSWEVQETVEGKKRKQSVKHAEEFTYGDLLSVKREMDF